MKNTIFLFFISLILSTIWYYYLHKKTRIRKYYLFVDNVIVGLLTFVSILALFRMLNLLVNHLSIIAVVVFIFLYSFLLTMIRFWRTPSRKINTKEGEVVSPADGRVLYIKKVESGNIPVSIKNGLAASLDEITKTDLIRQPSWLIGINMTPLDVHKNCSPINGKVVLNKHIKGSFLSLKEPRSLLCNERNTLVIKNEDKEYFGIIQTASKLVRRIDTYVQPGQDIKQGQWFGMIRFGSQVDLILPYYYNIKIRTGQQIFAIKSVIASK